MSAYPQRRPECGPEWSERVISTRLKSEHPVCNGLQNEPVHLSNAQPVGNGLMPARAMPPPPAVRSPWAMVFCRRTCAMDVLMTRCILLPDDLWAMDLCQSKPCNPPLAVRTPWALDSCQRTFSVSLNMDPSQCMQYNPRPALRIPWAMDLCRRTPRAGLDFPAMNTQMNPRPACVCVA